MNKQRLSILIASGLGAIATFMPWVKAPIIGTISGTKGDGWITFVLFSIAIFYALKDDKSKRIEGKSFYGVIIPPIIASLIGIWKIFDFNSKMANLGNNDFANALGASASIEFGLYLVVMAGIAVPILSFIIKDSSNREI